MGSDSSLAIGIEVLRPDINTKMQIKLLRALEEDEEINRAVDPEVSPVWNTGSRISARPLVEVDRENMILLRLFSFERFRANWEDIKDHLIYDPATYLGSFNDADNCYYQ
ncbi:MAG: hypothetical protein WA137_03600 [Methanothrix sp.]